MTPLHLAALGGRRDVVELLLAHGAVVNATAGPAPGVKGQGPVTPLRLVMGEAVAELLRQHGGY